MKRVILLILVLVQVFFDASAQSVEKSPEQQHPANAGGVSSEQMVNSNNPLADLNSINFQNYYTPKTQGINDVANVLYLRGVVVTGRHIIRATMPFALSPVAGGKSVSGFGDFNIFDAIKITSDSAKTQLGVGPMISIPTASRSALGSGKFQLGLAGVAIHPIAGGHMLGTLIIYQHSIFGNDNRSEVSLLSFQPVLTMNMGAGLYGRSAGAIWSFDLENNRTLIPIGFGIGKIFKVGNAMVNMFIEPEFTVYSHGTAQPMYQVLFGLNFQWANKKS